MEQTQIEKIKLEVFKHRPVLGEICHEFGKETLVDYVKDKWVVPNVLPNAEFVGIIENQSEKLFGKVISQAVVKQLTVCPLVSTIDHHGIWGHPFFVNSDLIFSLHFKPEEFAVVLATESVSLNNTTSWSGSLLCHNKENLNRYSFFPDRLKTLPVFSAPALTTEDLFRFEKNTQGKFAKLIEQIKFNDILNLPSFSAQACALSNNFWQVVFPSAPKLLVLPLETIVSEFLLQQLQDPVSIFYKIILTTTGQNLWKKFFFKEHTFMFWGIDVKGKRKILTSLPENTIELLQNKKIYPSSPLCFAVLLYAGLAAVGGFTQTTWLTQTKQIILELLNEMPGHEEFLVKTISQIPTKNFAESSLACLNNNDQSFNPSAVDLYLTGKDYYQKFREDAFKMTLAESLNSAMPTIYNVVVPKN